LLGVLAAEAPGKLERAVVHIRWEGAKFVVDAVGRIQAEAERRQFVSLYVLGRRPGTVTEPGQGLSSAHCPSCGGPMTIDTADKCEFCGAVFDESSGGWMLMDITAMASDEGRMLMARMRR